MTKERAILVTFVGLGLFLLGLLAREWLYGLLDWRQQWLRDFIDEGGLRAFGAIVALVGAFFWVKTSKTA